MRDSNKTFFARGTSKNLACIAICNTVAQDVLFWLLTSYYQIRTRTRVPIDPTSRQFGTARIMMRKNWLERQLQRADPATRYSRDRGKLTLSVSTNFKEVTLGEADIEFSEPEEGPAIV